MGPPSAADRAYLATSYESDADDCCTCRDCGTVGVGISLTCDECHAKQEAEWKAGEPARQAQADAEAKTREEALAKSTDRDAALALARRMSDISEECYCAGWLMGLEFTLWQFVQDGPGEWGMGRVSAGDVETLKRLAEKAGGWIVWRENVGETFVPMAEWLVEFAAGEAADDAR